MKSVELTILWYQNIINKKNSSEMMTKNQILDYMNDN